jgi:hypothetical protein
LGCEWGVLMDERFDWESVVWVCLGFSPVIEGRQKEADDAAAASCETSCNNRTSHDTPRK